MTENNRRPGRVGERATPVKDSASSAQAGQGRSDESTESGKPSASPSGSTDSHSSSERREPGSRVDGPASPMPDEQASAPPRPESSLPLDPPERSSWSSVLWLLLACVAFWGIGSAMLNLVELWQRQILLAAPLSVAGALLLALLSRALWLEWSAMHDVDELSERRKAVEEAAADENLAALKAALEPTLANLRTRNPVLINEFEEAASEYTECGDYLSSLDNIVIQSLDAQAKRVVENSALATGTAVVIVPHPAFDALVVLWRALVMTRRIGTLYGLRPGGLATWRLFAYTLRSALLAAGMDTLTTFLVDSSGQTLARTLKPVAEGSVTAVRIYRLGQLTIDVCRPIKR